jgi:hypothetical protein
MTFLRFAVLAAASSILACATPSGAPVAVTAPTPAELAETKFVADGQVFWDAQGSGTSVAFNDLRMVGPSVNMTRDTAGRWGGNIGDRNMILTVVPGKISGDGVDLYVVRKNNTTSVQGMYFQRQVWITVKAGEIQGTTDGGRCSFDLNPSQRPGFYTGGVGCGGSVRVGTLQLSGTAANLDQPPMPQLILALVAVLP